MSLQPCRERVRVVTGAWQVKFRQMCRSAGRPPLHGRDERQPARQRLLRRSGRHRYCGHRERPIVLRDLGEEFRVDCSPAIQRSRPACSACQAKCGHQHRYARRQRRRAIPYRASDCSARSRYSTPPTMAEHDEVVGRKRARGRLGTVMIFPETQQNVRIRPGGAEPAAVRRIAERAHPAFPAETAHSSHTASPSA